MSSFSCHTTTKHVHEGDCIPALVELAVRDLMEMQSPNGYLAIVRLPLGGFSKVYSLQLRTGSHGTECRAYQAELRDVIQGHPRYVRIGDWFCDFETAPFNGLCLKITEDFQVAFVLHRFQA